MPNAFWSGLSKRSGVNLVSAGFFDVKNKVQA